MPYVLIFNEILRTKIDLGSKAGFFLTSATEKTKTQAKNSSKKLREKTQAPGGISQKTK